MEVRHMTDQTVYPESAFRMLRDIRRQLVGIDAILGSFREELNGLRIDLSGEIGKVRGELKADIAGLRQELRTSLNYQNAALAP